MTAQVAPQTWMESTSQGSGSPGLPDGTQCPVAAPLPPPVVETDAEMEVTLLGEGQANVAAFLPTAECMGKLAGVEQAGPGASHP